MSASTLPRPLSLLPLRARAAAAVRSATAPATLALLAIAVHVADDNFLQPQPGTSARDHLVSGLVPLAILLAAAWAYGRVRPGARAVIGLLGGVFGLVTAVEAVWYASNGGPSGDDWTGFVDIPAGLLLIVLAVVTLWRSRRRDGSRLRRTLRRGLLTVAGLAVALFVAAPTGLAYVLTHTGRPPADVDLGPTAQDVTLRTSDGLDLAAVYVPSRNGATVIAFPGRSGPQEHARMLIRHGYGVLVLDQRGQGASEGDWDVSYAGTRDLNAALDYLAGRPDVDPERIGGLGLSRGGELLLQAAAESDALKAVVSEGAGVRTHREGFEVEVSPLEQVLSAPFLLADTAAMTVFTNHLPPANLVNLVGEITPRPVFLIHASRPVGGEQLNPQYYEALRGPKQIWKMADTSHTDGINTQPAEYERRVVSFLDDALLGPR